MIKQKIKSYGKIFFVVIIFGIMAGPANAFQLTPPKNIVHKQPLPIKQLHFIRTQEGITYLISQDGRYVFQGALFDVWNGEQIESISELNALENRINFKYIGVEPDKMLTLDMGRGTKEVFIFADPECGVCHKLLREVKESRQIMDGFLIRTVVVPILGPSSMEKAQKLALLAKTDAPKALDALIENSYDDMTSPDGKENGLSYNILLTKALNIKSVPYIVNSQGLVHKGLPEDLQLFLLKE